MAAIQFSSSQFDKKHIKGLSKREHSLSVLFSNFCKEVAVIGATTGFHDAKKEFYLSLYPAAQRAMKRLLAQLASDITSVVHTGNKAAWEISEDKNNALLQQIGRNITLPKHLQERVKQGSVNALAAFEERKVNGMNLSKRVWNLVQPLQGQMELALELGLSEGKGAASLSRDVRQYLLNPDKLFRRVRGKDGILRLSKAAAAYHPGQGVYRSSYKNALRMTVTENNMAYRSADYAQWEEMPFVIGTEIGLSNNHPVVDICDELAGVYPKDFKFVGWHPFCRCFATPKLADRSEVNKWARMTDEERKGYKFKGTVDALPKQFNAWVETNKERIAKAKTLPYFLKDNKEIIERAAKMKGYEGAKLGRKATKEVREAYNDYTPMHNYSKEQLDNFKEIERVTGYKRGTPMTFEEADNGHSNLYKDNGNCAACVLVHEMRLRGFNITALPYNEENGVSELLSSDTRSVWLTVKGKKPEFSALIGGNEKEIISKIEKQTQVLGSRYHIGWDISEELGHIVTAERTKSGLILYDPQMNNFISLGEIIANMQVGTKLQLLRVDKLLTTPELLNTLTTISK